MSVEKTNAACSSNDNPETQQFVRVCEILDKYQRDASKLVPILQEVQEVYRYLPEDVMTLLATGLGVPPAKVYGVATFYSYFTLKPRGKYTIRLCDGTACHVRNSEPILHALWKKLGLSQQQNTTPDMLFTVETVACLGSCGLAPVLVINEEVYGLMTPAKALELIEELLKKESVEAAA